jgi:undecaprenyl-diphosphatase
MKSSPSVDNAAAHGPGVAVAGAISFFADHGMAIALAAMFDVIRSKRTFAQACARLAAIGIPVIVATALAKRIVSRPRPIGSEEVPWLARVPTSSSFPSGHTLAAATAAVAIPATPTGFLLAGANVFSVGWSRLRLGAHHRSDVLGGVLLGAILGLALRPVLRFIDGNI